MTATFHIGGGAPARPARSRSRSNDDEKWGTALVRRELDRIVRKMATVGMVSGSEYSRMLRYARRLNIDLHAEITAAEKEADR